MPSTEVTRRAVVKGAAALALAAGCEPISSLASSSYEAAMAPELPEARPIAADRRFASAAVEETIHNVRGRIGDRNLGVLFANCFPNTLDTTVWPGSFEGKPDTFVVTGDIDAMWLRDSSAQLWPYLPLLKLDARLRELVEGVIRRQGRMIRLDPYANAFTRNSIDPPLSWAVKDRTKHVPGVGERKW